MDGKGVELPEPTEQQRDQFCLLAYEAAKQRFTDDWNRPRCKPDEHLGVIGKYSGMVADYAMRELATLMAALQQAEQQRDEAIAAREHSVYWYACRWERLKDWAKSDLSEQHCHEFFNIVANGTAKYSESPTYFQQFNRLKHRAERAEAGRDQAHKALAEMRASRDTAYGERDQLVCALSKLFPSWMERHPESDVTWEDDWRWIVFVNMPTGQASWHIHDDEFTWFEHLEKRDGNSWDGHTTTEKYARIARLEAIHALAGEAWIEIKEGCLKPNKHEKINVWSHEGYLDQAFYMPEAPYPFGYGSKLWRRITPPAGAVPKEEL